MNTGFMFFRRTAQVSVFLVALSVLSVSAASAEFKLPSPGQPEAGPVISLSQAVSRADKDNRSLMVLRQDIRIAAEKLRASWSGLLPTLYGKMNWSVGSQSQTNQAGVLTTGTRNQLSAGLSLNVPLISAQTWLDMDTAEIEADVTGLQVEQGRQVLLYSVAEAYFQAAAAHALIQVYKAQYDAALEHLELAQGRMDAGVGNIMDVKSAQTEMLTAWTGIVKAGYSLADAREALALLMGIDELPLPETQDSGADIEFAGEPDEEAMAALSDGGNLLIEVDGSVENRWDFKVLRKQQDMLKSQLKSAYMPFVPTLNGFFNYSADLLGNSPVAGIDRNQWSLGLNLSIPIFDYNVYPGLRQKKALIRQAELQIQETEAEAGKTVSEARRNVGRLARLVAAARVAASLADDLLTLAEADYANGTGLAIAVTDARRTSQSAHVDLATTTFEYEMAVLSLNRELGVDIRSALQER